MNIHFEPFKPINTSLYLCDNKFHTKPLSSLLANDDDQFAFIIMDGNGYLLGTLQGSTKQVLHKSDIHLPNKHGRGGQSQNRFQHLRLGARHQYVVKVAEMATEMFISENKANMAGLILAGNSDLKTELSKCGKFDPRLQAKIIKIVDISYGGERGFNEAIELASECLSNVKYVQEQTLMKRYFDEISRDTGKYCFGVNDTFKCLEMGAVDILICWQDLDVMRCSFKVAGSAEIKILYMTAKQEQDKSHLIDQDSGLEMELVDSQPLLEWLPDNYRSFGATLEIISDQSPEGSMFVRGFAGIGAILRYRCLQLADDQFNNDYDSEDY